MTFKGTYQHGIIILDNSEGLREGARVEVLPTPKRNGKRAAAPPKARAQGASVRRSSTTKSKVGAGSRRGGNPLLGMWKDRPDWKGRSTVDIAAELRRKALGGRFSA